jgi:hypothetical protein
MKGQVQMSIKQNKIIKERFSVDITEAGKTFKKSFEVDKNADKIIGIALSSDRDDIIYYRGTQAIRINDEEFFPEGFESKLLMSGINVPPNERYFRLGRINPGNRKVEIIYTDSGSDDMIPFTAHKVFLYVFSTRIIESTEK